MRNALTLIELILSMMIIGIVFTVIPRLVMSMNQSAQVTLKEEAMYNAMAQIGMILNLPWDENNTEHDQILQTDSLSYVCNSSNPEPFYRIGGFVGSRNCREENGTIFQASFGMEKDTFGNNVYNDIDDYDGNITTTKSCTNLYDLNTTVKYINEDTYANTPAGQTSNAKMIGVKVKYTSGHKFQNTANCITDLNYTSYNIGNIHINRRDW
ncbi:type II secretion system protein [Sulfuricurvum sp. RIFCSPLOWO2_12_FULL_43_24]|uniref:type II secretion system protein n=1 Tax=Sulfuricurvum sp. RIFCSPLOWO2_12_FULL_43_24 TaxID=1802247 RepID=UPI0008D1C731|nr:type II secretion system protein [Sulfuricurvum sp. RIFCSPLOWO2_12_FULL_43_24]OHD90099.1 MAG: hypothetical protein A3G19_10285 [Sulfuricurvum sp. RIFCSPLOWO2_12_FULL_43_24]